MATHEKSYNELKQELSEVIEVMQREDIDVDEALAAYEKGMKLVELLEKQLKDAQNKITKIKAKFDA